MQTALRKIFHGNEAVVKPITIAKSIDRHKRIAIRMKGVTHILRIEEIVRCLADSNYTTIYYGSRDKIMIAKTLKAVGDVLPASVFLRVHHSHIVRLDNIHLVYPNHIVLFSGDRIPLSRSNKNELMKRLTESAHCL